MDFDFENIMEFAMDIDKLNLANLEGKVMDKIMEYLVDTLRQLRILPGIDGPYSSENVWYNLVALRTQHYIFTIRKELNSPL